MDSDGQYEPRDIIKLLRYINSNYDLIIGRRKNRAEPFWRRFLSIALKAMVRLLFKPKIVDVTSALRLMKTEVGVVIGHPIKQMWLQVKTILKTWVYCRKYRLSCNRWYGVYETGTENILVQVGCVPGAEDRARKIASLLEND